MVICWVLLVFHHSRDKTKAEKFADFLLNLHDLSRMLCVVFATTESPWRRHRVSRVEFELYTEICCERRLKHQKDFEKSSVIIFVERSLSLSRKTELNEQTHRGACVWRGWRRKKIISSFCSNNFNADILYMLCSLCSAAIIAVRRRRRPGKRSWHFHMHSTLTRSYLIELTSVSSSLTRKINFSFLRWWCRLAADALVYQGQLRLYLELDSRHSLVVCFFGVLKKNCLSSSSAESSSTWHVELCR